MEYSSGSCCSSLLMSDRLKTASLVPVTVAVVWNVRVRSNKKSLKPKTPPVCHTVPTVGTKPEDDESIPNILLPVLATLIGPAPERTGCSCLIFSRAVAEQFATQPSRTTNQASAFLFVSKTLCPALYVFSLWKRDDNNRSRIFAFSPVRLIRRKLVKTVEMSCSFDSSSKYSSLSLNELDALKFPVMLPSTRVSQYSSASCAVVKIKI
mmetsp:Transcript_41727/g.100116  ORF Transcript_41727/g.100116 Transcript_41727/m.100116 type:complete len:209 (-) Transcript_41727:2248-2874(-)